MRTPTKSALSRARLVVFAVVCAIVTASLVPTAAAYAGPTPAPSPAPKHHPLVMGSFKSSTYAGQAAHLPAGLSVALKRDLNETPAEYLADAAAAAQAVKVVASLKSAGVHVLGSKIHGTSLTVNIAASSDKAAVTAAGATAVVGAPVAPDLGGRKFHTDAATVSTYGGEGFWFKTAAQQTTNFVSLCSIGFNGYSVSAGTSQFVTAGHCASVMTGNASLITQNAPADTGSGAAQNLTNQTLGTAVSGESEFGSGGDYGIVNANAAGLAPQASIYQWNGGTGNPLATPGLPITGQSAGIVGGSLCKSGATSGWTCGRILAVDADALEDNQHVNTIVATTCVLQGDSGGPAVVGQNAVGINSGSDFPRSDDGNVTASFCNNGPNCTTLSDGVTKATCESVFFPMVSAGPQPTQSVVGQAGSNWKLLAAPAVTSPANGAAVASGAAMTGTLFNPLSGSTVSLYLDGSSTAAATVSSSSGTWSIPLTGAGVGTHSYSLTEAVGGNQIAVVPGTFVVLAAGMLVKTASAPTIYLYDGAGTLIPVASFSTISDFAIPTTYYTVPDSVVAGSSIASAVFSNLVSCGGVRYLGAQGKLWAVTSGQIGSLPVQTLSSALCATLSVSSTPLSSTAFIKGSAATIYALVNGQKEPVVAYSQLVQLSAPNAPFWLTMNDGYIGSIPTGPALVTAGSLVKSASNPTIYVFDGSGGLIPVPSFGIVTDLGLSTSYSTVADATITGLSPIPLSNLVSCGGTTYLAAQGQIAAIPSSASGSLPVETLASTLCAVIPKASSSLVGAVFVKGSAASIYQLVGGKLLTMTSYAQMQTISGSSAPTWLTINDSYLSSVPIAPTVVVAGSLVKSASSSTIYLADGNGGLIPVASFGTISDMGLSTAYSTVSASTISSLVVSGTALQNLVKCGTTTYLADAGTLNPVSSAAIGSLPVETLASTLCSVTPIGTTALPNVLFIKGSASTIYYLSAGTKDPVSTYAQMQALSGQSSPTWITMNDVYIGSIPVGTIPSS